MPPVMVSPAEALVLATGGLLAERMTEASVGESIFSVTKATKRRMPLGRRGIRSCPRGFPGRS